MTTSDQWSHHDPAVRALIAEARREGVIDGLSVVTILLRKVADYWDGRPLAGHGDQHLRRPDGRTARRREGRGPQSTGERPVTERLRVTVTVDTDDLREWADRHADMGNHGVAHVLYQAAKDGESLTEQAIREAEKRGEVEALQAWAHVVRDHDMPPNKDRRGYDYRMGWWDAVAYADRILTRGLRSCEECPGPRAHRIPANAQGGDQ